MNLNEAKQILKNAGYLIENENKTIEEEIVAGESGLICIGDPGLILLDKLYDNWDYKNGAFYKNGHDIMVSVPTYTDGKFEGTTLDFYTTDTATIALIPVEYCKYKSNEELDANNIWALIVERGSLHVVANESEINIDCQGQPVEHIILHK